MSDKGSRQRRKKEIIPTLSFAERTDDRVSYDRVSYDRVNHDRVNYKNNKNYNGKCIKSKKIHSSSLNIHHRFIVSPITTYIDPNLPLNNSNIIRVISNNIISCPICLSPPTCPRILSCSHILCLPCLLTLLSSILPKEQKLYNNAIKEVYNHCPLCFSFIRLSETLPVLFLVLDDTPVIGLNWRLSLMVRRGGLAVPSNILHGDILRRQPHSGSSAVESYSALEKTHSGSSVLAKSHSAVGNSHFAVEKSQSAVESHSALEKTHSALEKSQSAVEKSHSTVEKSNSNVLGKNNSNVSEKSYSGSSDAFKKGGDSGVFKKSGDSAISEAGVLSHSGSSRSVLKSGDSGDSTRKRHVGSNGDSKSANLAENGSGSDWTLQRHFGVPGGEIAKSGTFSDELRGKNSHFEFSGSMNNHVSSNLPLNSTSAENSSKSDVSAPSVSSQVANNYCGTLTKSGISSHTDPLSASVISDDLPDSSKFDYSIFDDFPYFDQSSLLSTYARVFKGDFQTLTSFYSKEKQDLINQFEQERILYNQQDSKFHDLAIKHIDNEIKSWQEKFESVKNEPHKRNSHGDSYQSFNFYQTGFNTNCVYVLSPLDMKVLKTCYKSYDNLPTSISVKIENIRYEELNEDNSITKYKYLNHFPLGTQLGFLECDWQNNNLIDLNTWKYFESDLIKRTKNSLKKLRREEKDRKRALIEEEIRTKEFYANANGYDVEEDYYPTGRMGTLSIIDHRDLPSLAKEETTTEDSSNTPVEYQTTIWGTQIPKGDSPLSEDEDDFEAEEMIRKAREELDKMKGKGKKKKKKIILTST